MSKDKEFEISSLMLFILMMGANVFNYLFQLVMGNMLSVEDFGILNTLMSMVTILLVPNLLLVMVVARYIAIYKARNKKSFMKKLFFDSLKVSVCVSFAMLFIGIISSEYINNIFNIRESNYFILITVNAGLTLVASVFFGCLQGLKQFFNYGIQNLINVGCKLLISILLVYLGFELYGVLFSLIIGIVLAGIYALIKVNKVMDLKANKEIVILPYKEIMKYSLGAFLAQACITVLTNGDILLVKIFFSDTTAGVYSSAMVLGKIAMYIANAVVATLFPMVAASYENGENVKNYLIKAMFYGGGSAIICSLGLVLGGEFIIPFLFGSRYTLALEYLPYVCAFIIPLTFLTVIMNYVLAIGKTKMFSVSIICALMLIIMTVIIEHSTVEIMLLTISLILSIATVFNVVIAFKKY